MKVRGLDGREYSWRLTGHLPKGSDERPRSTHHLRARALLEKLYPMEPRLEEVPLPGSGGLFADFVLPARKLVVEVNGEQHYHFSYFFHKTRLGFVQSQARDRLKVDWCELNGLTHIELPHDESDDEWACRIRAGGTASRAGQ